MSKKVLAKTLADILATGTVIVPVADAPPADAPPADVPPVEPPAADAVPPPATPAAGAPDALTAFLKEELAAKNALLLEANNANAALQAQVKAFEADNVPGLKASLTKALELAAVPINATLIGVESFTGAQLASTYDKVLAKLQSVFSAGAKSSTEVKDSTVPTKPAASVPPAIRTTPATKMFSKD